MARRATEQEVKAILFDTDLELEDLAPFLEMANTLIDDLLGSEGYTPKLMRLIETNLAAHFVAATKDKEVTAEQFGDTRVTYGGTLGKGLDATSYGQQVKILDHHGILAAISGASRPAEVKAIL